MKSRSARYKNEKQKIIIITLSLFLVLFYFFYSSEKNVMSRIEQKHYEGKASLIELEKISSYSFENNQYEKVIEFSTPILNHEDEYKNDFVPGGYVSWDYIILIRGKSFCLVGQNDNGLKDLHKQIRTGGHALKAWDFIKEHNLQNGLTLDDLYRKDAPSHTTYTTSIVDPKNETTC